MSVAAVLLGYGSTLLLAGAFGVESSSDKMPSTTAMAAVALATGALAMTGPVPPKKGEPGFARYMAAVHLGLLEPVVFAGVHALRAYHSRGSLTDMVPPAALAGLSITTLTWLASLKPKKVKVKAR